MPDYSTHDPKGWCGDPRRGAALGRATIQEGDAKTVTGRMTLRRVRMSADGAYDSNGTYFGCGDPLYWCAYSDDDHDVDFVIRARSRDDAKAQVLEEYPDAKFFS